MHLEGTLRGERVEPLARVTLAGLEPGTVTVRDGMGREYVRAEVGGQAATRMTFTVGGTLGHHTVQLHAAGGVASSLTFRVAARTRIDDAGGRFADLLELLHYSMLTDAGDYELRAARHRGRTYRFLVCWLRDHVHVLKGMKYFSAELEDGIDLYRASQRADGMIWDNVALREGRPNAWDVRFTTGDFIRPFEDGRFEFKRIPVEADVEYLFVEGLHATWKATGDDAWMARNLDAAVRALQYTRQSPLRWSDKYQLVKRGFTIDTWDFQPAGHGTDSGLRRDDPMVVDADTTRFGVMFGDNTGYAAACRALAEMLEHAGRAEEARAWRERAGEILGRVDELAWAGGHYRHHVSEDGTLPRALGVDEAEQVSLSNAYSLNRGIPHERCAAIITTYRKLREGLPEGAPGEWYTIYPPFGAGFDEHHATWQYMDAGVTPIVAGELARGAFEHGFERYGVDILERVHRLGERHGQVRAVYTGATPDPGPRGFTPVDLAPYANADLHGDGAPGVPGWCGRGDDDLRELPVGDQVLAGLPFRVTDPAGNHRRGAVVLSRRGEYAVQVDIPVEARAASLYLLHTVSGAGTGGVGGLLTLHYAGGGTCSRYVVLGENVSGLWFPEAYNHDKQKKHTEVAWRGRNPVCPDIGVLAWGLDNPHPDRIVERVTLTAAEDGAFWGVLGLTLSDVPVHFPPDPVSAGIPHAWAAAAVVYALVEGLAGVVDTGVGLDRVRLAPRWSAAGTATTAATVTYPSSGGYVAYRYHHDPAAGQVELEVTGGGDQGDCHLLLPQEATRVTGVRDRNGPVDFTVTTVESSRYVDFPLRSLRPDRITIDYATG